ncbi:MAG: hypothetical protein IMW89_22330 [Ktedonobacteraceae bacterium]|nr:hypothetical protein [Ktedonobacteraceae bacterium]
MKTIYCLTITPRALSLIRSFDGDVVGREAILCHYVSEEPGRDKWGNVVDGSFKVTFPNGDAICYNLSGAIAFVL